MEDLLKGVRVLDFGRYVAGPYCATLLGCLGADVIRVEKAAGGEDRHIAPIEGTEFGGLFLQTGANKRSLALNFRDPATRGVIDRLLESADMVVVNLPPAALKKIGLDWERVHAINPRLILVTQTAFGSKGPLADRGGFDGVAQAMSGAMYMSGTEENPVKAAAPYVDFSTALLSAFGALAALRARHASGLGQHVETDLLSTAMAVFGSHLAEQAALGIDRNPTGNRVQTSGPSDVFKTLDGHILTHVVGHGLFARCADLLGREDWLNNDELLNDQQRGNQRDRLCTAMSEWCAVRDSATALSELQQAGIPAGPVLNLQQALEQPQVAAMNVLTSISGAGLEQPLSVVDMPLKFSAGEAGLKRAPPGLGEHNREILQELGYSNEEIAQFS